MCIIFSTVWKKSENKIKDFEKTKWKFRQNELLIIVYMYKQNFYNDILYIQFLYHILRYLLIKSQANQRAR